MGHVFGFWILQGRTSELGSSHTKQKLPTCVGSFENCLRLRSAKCATWSVEASQVKRWLLVEALQCVSSILL